MFLDLSDYLDDLVDPTRRIVGGDDDIRPVHRHNSRCAIRLLGEGHELHDANAGPTDAIATVSLWVGRERSRINGSKHVACIGPYYGEVAGADSLRRVVDGRLSLDYRGRKEAELQGAVAQAAAHVVDEFCSIRVVAAPAV